MNAARLTRTAAAPPVRIVHLGLGDKDKAFAFLEKAYEERAFEILGFSGRLFDRLHGEPRFQDLLRRMRLPTAAPIVAAAGSR